LRISRISGDEAGMNTYEAYADELVGQAYEAAARFRLLDQEQVDRIVEAAFRASFEARIDLARMALEETGMGVLEHKVVKNAWSSLLIYEHIRGRRTVGILSHDPDRGITEVAQPIGPVLALTPVTNPTSTTIFKALICLKTRNPVILSPHRGARRCCREAARILGEAAGSAGAPENAIQWISKAQIEYLDAIMHHRRLALILATGTTSIVRRAQLSGTPTLGVGPGNVPVYVHASADIPFAARMIVHSKTFDNGTVCASEQSLVVEPEVDLELRPLLQERGAYFCTREQMLALGPVCFDPAASTMRADIVGQPARAIAERAGFTVPERTRLLIAEPDGVGFEHPLSFEILAPVLAYYRVKDYAEALGTCAAVTHLGGVGHTVGLYANDESVVSDFAGMDASRILVNTPTTEGALGGIFNHPPPSLTLACGTGAGNVTTDNITIDHLLNIHRVARMRPNLRWLDIPREVWLDPQVGAEKIRALYNRNY
jgi:acetaldehyde dehydrogenase/alcohol dehydrogenase